MSPVLSHNLQAPLLLARGEPLHHREGILLVLQAQPASQTSVAFVGDLSPRWLNLYYG